MNIRRVFISSVVTLCFLCFGLVGCANNDAKASAMTGETQTHESEHWSQP